MEDIEGTIVTTAIERHGTFYQRAHWRTITRLTNVDEPTQTFEIEFNSIINLESRPDGTLGVIGRNDVIAWYAPGDPSELGPGIWLINHGQVFEEYDSAGTLVSAGIKNGEITDVCAALS